MRLCCSERIALRTRFGLTDPAGEALFDLADDLVQQNCDEHDEERNRPHRAEIVLFAEARYQTADANERDKHFSVDHALD